MANKYITQFPIEVEDFDPATKQDKLTAGNGITLNGATIATDNDTTLTSATKPAQGKAVGDALALKADKTYVDDELAEKANVDGTYPSLTAGLAEQLLSNNRVTDQTPYLYRQTALGKANATRALMKKIVGGSVVWNQCVKSVNPQTEAYGITRTRVDDGGKLGLRYSGTSTKSTNFTAVSIPASLYFEGHKYLCNLGVSLPSGCRINYSPVDKTSAVVYNAPPTYSGFGVIINDDTTVDFTTYPMAFDLTAMFGTTIADYIYLLERATAGSGIAKLREWGFFTEDYYEYCEPTLMSVEGLASKKTVGFNQWDGLWEQGEINSSTGQNAGSKHYWRSVGYIPCLPLTAYHAYSPTASNKYIRARFYDADKNYVGYVTQSGDTETDSTFVTPANAHYMRIVPAIEDVPNHDICINISDPQRNGTYEPYVKHTYPLDSSLTLRGIPKLDSNNNLYYDGDEYRAVGKYGTRTFDGNDNWTWGTGTNLGRVVSDVIPDAVNTSSRTPVSGKNIIDATGTDPYTGFLSSGRFYFYYPTTVTTLDEWKAWVNANSLTITYPITQVTRRYGIVDLGTLNYTYQSENTRFLSSVSAKANGYNNIICAKYSVPVSSESSDFLDKQIKGFNSSNQIAIKDTDYTDATALKAALSGVYLGYELATPTTETAEPYTEVQVVDKDGTEEFVTSGIVPVGHVTEYPYDNSGKLDDIPDLPTTAGSYVLRVTVTSGKASYEWVSA